LRDLLKAIIFKLSYNNQLRKIAKKIFVYLPGLKTFLIDIRDNSYVKKEKKIVSYESDFLSQIKKEIEEKKNSK
jgi:hypothetical protein